MIANKNFGLLSKVLDFKAIRFVSGKVLKAEDLLRCHDNDGIIFDEKRALSDEDYKQATSTRASRREPALTRQITTLAYKVGKEMISLAEGMPNEETFPFSEMILGMKDGRQLKLDGKRLAAALQYIPSQGLPSLLSQLRELQQHIHAPPLFHKRDILVTSGSQDGLYKCVDLLLEPGQPVLLQIPTYNGIDIVLKPYKPEIISIPEDEDGTIPEFLQSVLEERCAKGLSLPKLMYLVPTGNNPTGSVISNERRRKIYDLACKFNFYIIEDDPYMFMNYSEDRVVSFLSMDIEGRVLRLDSLSKVLSSGLRAGWVTAPRPLLERLELHMQASHLHAATLSQAVLSSLLQEWGQAGLCKHLFSVRALYKKRRDLLQTALLEHVGELAEWKQPQAGMFFWLKVKDVDDVYNMVFHTAFERGLMLVPGQACTLNSRAPCQYLRLAFSKAHEGDFPAATSALADVIRHEQSRSQRQTSVTQR